MNKLIIGLLITCQLVIAQKMIVYETNEEQVKYFITSSHFVIDDFTTLDAIQGDSNVIVQIEILDKNTQEESGMAIELCYIKEYVQTS